MKPNYLFMFLTVIVSGFIWLQINLSKEQITLIEIPIKITNLPENLYLFPQTDIVVPVRVTGKGLYILFYYFNDHLLFYDGSQVSLGENTLDLTKIDYSSQKNTHLNFAAWQTEENTTFIADVILQKTVPVIYDFFSENDKISLQNNSYVFDEINVTISGPGQLINGVNSIFSDKIGAEILRSKNQIVRLQSPSEHIMVTPQSIELRLVTKTLSSKTLTMIPIAYNSQKYSIFPERVSVKIEGTMEALNSTTNADIVASINDADYRDLSTTRINLSVPENVKVLDFTPTTITVKVK